MPSIDINAILEEIRENVRLRRLSGDYPPGLENELEQEFQLIMESTNRSYRIDVEAQTHLSEANEALKRLLARYENQKEAFDQTDANSGKEHHQLDPWSFVAPEVVEIEHHVLATLRLLADYAHQQQDADKRLVEELSQHVLDRFAVVDHLAILTQELEARLRNLERNQG